MGIDSLLRNKIWDYLKTLVQTTDTTVIISTHYIQESMMSTCVGLMRKGKILIEQDPIATMATLKVDSLEEAFLKLCQEQNFAESNKISNVSCHESANDSRKTPKQPFDFSKKRLMALLTKNYIHQKRSKM